MSPRYEVPSLAVRVLLIEDSELDAELLIDHMREAGLLPSTRRVDDEDGVIEALAGFQPDVVLSDLSMPGFSGYRALELIRERSAHQPFIFVSGTIGEEEAVRALREGATDYILKHNLARLGSAVRRAMREAEEQRSRDRAESELMRSQRFESLALLAGGLSHDLRNILQPLLMVAPMITERSDDPKLHKVAELVSDCAKRGLDMVSSMLSFARGSGSDGSEVSIGQLLQSLELLLQGTIPGSIRLRIEQPDPKVVVHGNETEFQQCLLNLCLNGIQAMPDGGDLTLAAQTVDLSEDDVEGDENAAPGEYVHIRVADTGIGMPDDVRQRLFTPFFTTKNTGTGLGLLSCKRIVTNQRGFIRVDSEPGKGSNFSVFVPTRRELEESRLDENGMARGNQRVLLISEEAATLSLLHDALELRGFQVEAAQNGAVALRKIHHGGMPELIIVDADLRLLSGVRTLAELEEIGFDGRVLLLIDASRNYPAEELPSNLRITQLKKPLEMKDFIDAVAAGN